MLISNVIKKMADPEIIAGSSSPIHPGFCSPDCPECSGSGWLRLDLPITDPNFGKLVRCKHAPAPAFDPLKYGLTEEEIDYYTWSRVRDINNVNAAIGAVQATLKRGWGWVYLWGGNGLAKSLILKIVVSSQLRDKKPAGYVRMAELMDNLRAAFDDDNPGEEAIRRLDFWAGLPILAIEELEKINETKYVQDRRFVLFDRRYEDGLPPLSRSVTLISSNKPPDTMDLYLSSRIRHGLFSVIKMEGDDVRPLIIDEAWR